jgi:glycine/serine hydroxymethyltransferase
MKNIVNKIATLKAEIARLSKEEKSLTEQLKAQGAGTYQGTEHYLVISEVTRETLDMKAVRSKLSRQFITANTNVTHSLTSRIYGYSQKMAA